MGVFKRRIRRTNQHGVSGPEHDTWNADWDESSWDSTSNWSYEPRYSAVLLLELLPATQDSRVDCLSSVSESDDGDLHATMSAMHSAARTFTEARDPKNRVRNARGDDPIVGLAALLAIENASKGVQKGAKTGKCGKGKCQEHERKEKDKRQRARAGQKGVITLCFMCNQSGHSGFTSFAMASIWSDCFSGFQGLEAIRDAHFTSGTKDSFEINTAPDKQISYISAKREVQTSNSRVTFSMPVTSEISVGLHFSCFGQEAPTVLGLDVIPDTTRGTGFSRRLQVYLPVTT